MPVIVIPGLREAVERETETRLNGFLLVPKRLCGVEVDDIAPIHFYELELCGNPLVCGGTVKPEDVAQFVWCLSVARRTPPGRKDRGNWKEARQQAAGRLVGSAAYFDSIRDCEAVVEAAMMDAPGGKSSGVPHACWLAALVDRIASEYGWTEAAILYTPLNRLWQYLRCITKRHDPMAVLFNPSDAVKREYLKTLTAPA